MNVSIETRGIDKLTKRVGQLEYAARGNKLIRRGISEAARIVARAIRNAAPVRRSRVSVRKLDKLMKRRRGWVGQGGYNLANATRRASVVQTKKRKPRAGWEAHGDLAIKPGQLKRSIHSRVYVRSDGLYAKAGMNVGLKRNDRRRAPHAHLVALGTKLRRTRLKGSRPGHLTGRMPPNPFARLAANLAAPAALRALNFRVKEDVRRVWETGQVPAFRVVSE